jgi:hypothetical protein
MDHMGVPHEQIAEILGHAGTRTTKEVYRKSRELHQVSEIREVCPEGQVMQR